MDNSGLDQLVCGQCQHSADSLTSFLLHKVQHVDTGQPGGCPLCGLAFSRQVSLREHLHRKHSIPGLGGCTASGKRRGRPRSSTKKLSSTDTDRHSQPPASSSPSSSSSPDKLPGEDSGVGVVPAVCGLTDGDIPSCGLTDIPSSSSPVTPTVHVVVDKLSDHDLTAGQLSSAGGVLHHHTHCSALSSTSLTASSSATVIVETCRDSGFGHLVEQHVDHVSSGGDSPSRTTFQPQTLLNGGGGEEGFSGGGTQDQASSHCDVPDAESVPCTLPQSLDNALHLLQSHHNDSINTQTTELHSDTLHTHETVLHPDHLHTPTTVLKDRKYMPCGDVVAVSVSEAMGQESCVLPSLSCRPLKPGQSDHMVSGTRSTEQEPDLDFVFILLTSHMKRKSMNYSKQSFKCFHCHYKTFWRRALVKHMREMHADHLAIHQCLAVSSSEKLHGQQVIRMSDYLSALAKQRKQVNGNRIRGVERQDMPGYHPCSSCDKVFGRLRYLRKHQVIHRQEKSYLCDDCGKAFKTKAYLAAHRQTHLAKVYRCSQCDFTSSINALIHTHRQLHNDNSVICEVCGSAYNDRATLKKHKQVHDTSRPFPCDYPGCTWRFKTEVMCRAHYRAHTTAGRFVCSLCSYVFRHKHHLQRHLGKIHGMDEAAVYRTTCSGSTKTVAVTATSSPANKSLVVADDKEYVEVLKAGEEEEVGEGMADTVSLIVNTGLSTEQLQSVLESGQFVIATDDDNDNSVNYEIANIAMSVNYDALTDHHHDHDAAVVAADAVVGDAVSLEGQTVFIPGNAECSQIIYQHDSHTVTSNVEM